MSEDFSPSAEKPALVIGAAGVDIVGRLKGDLHPGTSNPGWIRTSYGGVARNVAENLARLGQPVNLITVVGSDSTGEDILKQASSAGIDVEAVLRSPEYRTGSYLAVVNSSGEMQFALDDMRAISYISPDYLREKEELFEQASLLFVDANLPKDALRTAFSLARRYRLPVCADPTSTTLANRFCPYLSRLYLITPNSAEAAILCGHPYRAAKPRQALEAAKYLVTQGVKIAVVTLAEFGVCYATSETSGHVPAIRTEIIDPTGAGDALTAAVLFALLNDISLDDAIRLGVSAASLTLRYRGAVVPDLSLEKLYDQLAM
jgi:pseudouridine kinase